MPIVYIGIGSNIGNRAENCLKAIEILKEEGLEILRQSSQYETKPWGLKDQPEFINMAIEAETALSPRELLVLLKDIENTMGRLPSEKWGPRIIDLDILFYDDLIINENDLIIPHPFMREREFVLRPLSEIAPEKIHPVILKKVKDISVLN